MRFIAGTVVLVLSAGIPAARSEPLTRAEAVTRAVKSNPVAQRAREDLRVLEGRKREAIADALPDVKLTGTALRYRDPSFLNSPGFDSFPAELRDLLTVAPANLYEGSAVVHQTLFTFRLGGAIRAAKHGLAMGQEQVRRAELAIALEAVRSYNAYLLQIEKRRVAEDTLAQKERHLELARNRRAAGVATELEVLRAAVDVENQRAQLAGARAAAVVARAALNAVMMRPVDESFEPADSLAFVPFDTPLDQIVSEALANRPDVRALRQTERAYEQLVGVARADGLPRLDFDAAWGYQVRELGNFGRGDYTRWNASIALTVPVFDGLRTAGRVAQARGEVRKVTQDRLALETQIRLDAQAAFERLSTARTVLTAAEANVVQARKALEMTQANYSHGAATTLDVVDAQAALTLAESIRLEALHEHADTRATLRYVMGRDPLDPVTAADSQERKER
jgi:outer membrane protein